MGGGGLSELKVSAIEIYLLRGTHSSVYGVFVHVLTDGWYNVLIVLCLNFNRSERLSLFALSNLSPNDR